MRARAIALLFALAACGRVEEAYPPQYELNFMQACGARNPAVGVCACTWAKIEAEVPRRDFEALERMPASERDTSPIQGRIAQYARECASANAP